MIRPVKELEEQHTSGVYAKRELVMVRGEGALLFDDQGRSYIDCVGGQGVANLGHSHPAIIQAIINQANKLIHCPEMFYNDQRAELQARLIEAAQPGFERVFLCNSGTEAVEAALKFAMCATGRRSVVASMRGFHGRTLGALSATWNQKYRRPYEPLLSGFSHLPFNNPERLKEAVTAEVAAVVLEVVQGEGGVYPATSEYLQTAQDLCRETGAMLIIDEVQTGFGRTGKLFAIQHHDLQPDMVCLAKSLAGGLPMGAVLIGSRLGKLPTGSHGSTFGGNPLSCAAALAALDVYQSQDLSARAANLGAYLQEKLSHLSSPKIREVRGLGLMIGVELREKVAPYLQALGERGILALSAGMTVIRLLPPLVIQRDQLDTVVETLGEVLSIDGLA